MFCEKPEISRRIVILGRRLDQGGAQRQFIELAIGLHSRGRDVHVVLFYPGGAFMPELAKHGVPIQVLGKHGRWDTIRFLIRFVNCLRRLQPDLIYSFMGLPNILAVTLKPLITDLRIVWGVRSSDMDLSRYDWLSRLAYALECRLARFADRIISNSYAGKCHAVLNGFPKSKMVVIPNGIDTEYFRFDPEARRKLRLALGFGIDDMVVCLAARLDPMKGHLVFLEAASYIVRESRHVRFVCVGGDGPADYAAMLRQHASALGLTKQLIWAGARDDMPAIYSAIDIAVSSSSYGEGFSNAIAEAMACGLPCVVTDVGDSAFIVGDTGTVVPAGDPTALASEIQRLANLPRKKRWETGATCRARIVSEFSMDRLLQRSEHVLDLV